MKRSPLKKVSEKKKKEKTEGNPDKWKMWQTFHEIWESTPYKDKVCYETGEQIYSPGTHNFHHVLEKEKYPEYLLEKWNIILVSWQVHDQAHMDLDKTPKIKELKQKLIEEYGTGNNENN